MGIELVSTLEASYLVPFRVSMHSLLRHKSPETRVRWHIWDTGLSPDCKAELEGLTPQSDVELVWHGPAGDGIDRLPTRGRAIPKMYERLLVPDLLEAGIDRFLYLDCDLLVMDDIAKLWSEPLDGNILAAVPDLAVPRVSSPMGLRRYRELGFSAEARYFNAGVFLADVESWRRHEIGSRALAYLERYGRSVNLMDQDALNAVIRSRWRPLDVRWNLTGGLVARDHYRVDGIDPVELRRAIADPGIIHFSGLLKPWVIPRLGSRWTGDYERLLAESCPQHRLDTSIRARGLSFYDRELRGFLYPLERVAWRTLRGF